MLGKGKHRSHVAGEQEVIGVKDRDEVRRGQIETAVPVRRDAQGAGVSMVSDVSFRVGTGEFATSTATPSFSLFLCRET